MELDWSLSPAGPVADGFQPVRGPDGPAVLRTGAAPLEHLALQAWAGRGAVRLLRADPHRRVILLEPVAPAGLDTLEACALIGEVYALLHRPAGPQFLRLSERVAGWLPRLERLVGDHRIPRRYAVEARSYASGFVDDPATDGTLLHTELDADRLWTADRPDGPELVAVAPAPLSGDPCFEPAPVLAGRWGEAVGARRPQDELRDRYYAVVDAAGLDEARVRAWTVVRTLAELDVTDPAAVERAVLIIKSLPT